MTGTLHKVFDPSILPRFGALDPANPRHLRGSRDIERPQQMLQDLGTQSRLRLPPIEPDMLKKSPLENSPLPDDRFKEATPALSLERLGDVALPQFH